MELQEGCLIAVGPEINGEWDHVPSHSASTAERDAIETGLWTAQFFKAASFSDV